MVSIIVAALCPFLLFILCWWIVAALAIYHFFPVPENVIPISAFTGLASGVILDIFCLRNWVHRFYNVNPTLLLLTYLFCSAIMLAFFMGLPFGNLVMGALGGTYVGRKYHHSGADRQLFSKKTWKIGAFTAFVTGVGSLLIGLLALGENLILELGKEVSGDGAAVTSGSFGVMIVILLSLILMAVQYWFTRTAAWFAYKR